MRVRVIMLGITGLILSGYLFVNDETKLDDIGNLKTTVNGVKDYKQIHLTGLLGDSIMDISDIKIISRNDELNTTLFQKLAGSECSGTLDKEVTLENNIKKIIHDSKREII